MILQSILKLQILMIRFYLYLKVGSFIITSSKKHLFQFIDTIEEKFECNRNNLVFIVFQTDYRPDFSYFRLNV
jgi:hypothetical protein